MIKRIYIDNFRCLVNFEWRPKQIAILLGGNGTGKTSVVDALWLLRKLIANQEEVRRCFPRTSLARWESRLDTTLEVDLQLGDLLYSYKLKISHSREDLTKSRIEEESLHCGSNLLMRSTLGELHLHRDDGSAGPVVTVDWNRSALAGIAPGKDNKCLTEFKRWFREELWLLRPDPRAMSSRTDEEADELTPSMSNVASWLPTWMSQDVAGILGVTHSLQNALTDFLALQVSRSAPRLEARFKLKDGTPFDLDFADLSDGQRQLCGLYIALHAFLQPGRLVIFDEPENYVTLREIQPWLQEVLDHSEFGQKSNVWFISHHPELLDQLAPQHGVVFFRDQGPVRTRPFSGSDGLTPSETMARGWDS